MGLLKRILEKLFLWCVVCVASIYFFLIMLYVTIRYTPMIWFRKTKRSERPSCMNRPELGTHGFIQTKETELHYVAAGDRDKPLMIFLHGFPECWYSWRYQLLEFKKDYRVIAVDTRGFAESQKPRLQSSYTADKVAGDIKDLLSQLGYSSCTLVAHDWGGIIAWYFAGEFPDLVDKLVIMNSPHPSVFEKTLKSSLTQLLKSLYIFFYQLPWIPEMFLSCNDYKLLDIVFRNEYTSKEDCEAFKYAIGRPGALTAGINYYRANFKTQSDLRWRDSILCPTLIVWGMKDKYLDVKLLDDLEQYVRDLTIRKVPDGDHFVQQDKPYKVNEIMRCFLQGGEEGKEDMNKLD